MRTDAEVLKNGRLSSLRRVMAMGMTVMLLILCSSLPVMADMGPKPSISIRVENAPSPEYYLALFSEESGQLSEAGKEKLLKRVGDEACAKLFDLEFDGQRLYVSPVGHPIYKSNEEGKYRFTYSVPKTFTVVLMTKDGTIYKSESGTRSVFANAFVYDVTNGTLQQDASIPGVLSARTAFIAFCVYQAFIYFFATLLIEGIILLCFGLFRTKNIGWFALINLITQILLNVFNIAFIFMPIPGRYYYLPWFLVEVIITLIEVHFLKTRLVYKSDEVRKKRNTAFAITANVVSALIDIPVVIIFTLAGIYL
ncbi:MAG: hypothetical protein J5750_03725 [Clostridiales bacterium]|nr:hypothetical protein [Clostridiales bacterium]